MQRGRLVLMSVLVLALAGTGVLLATNGRRNSAAHASAATSTDHQLRSPSFETSLPAGWYFVQERTTVKGARTFHLSSTGAAVDGLGIAPKGVAAITVAESAPGSLAADRIGGRPAETLAPAALMAHVIAQPREAVSLVTAQAPKASRLDGASAADAAFGYGFHGRGMLQMDVIARHGGRLFTVELDAEPGLVKRGQAALSTMLSSWHWR